MSKQDKEQSKKTNHNKKHKSKNQAQKKAKTSKLKERNMKKFKLKRKKINNVLRKTTKKTKISEIKNKKKAKISILKKHNKNKMSKKTKTSKQKEKRKSPSKSIRNTKKYKHKFKKAAMLNKKKYVKTKHRNNEKKMTISKYQSRNDKSKNRSKEKRLTGTQRNLKPDHPVPQTYTNCDIYGLTKAQSVSRTQYNRANRVYKKVRALQKRSTGAATAFTEIFKNLQDATDGGKTCKGVKLSDEGVEIFNTLKNCSETVPLACNIAKITSYPAVQGNIVGCQAGLLKYGNDYKVSSGKWHKKLFFGNVVFPGSHV